MKKSKFVLVAAAIVLIGQPAFSGEQIAPDQPADEQAQMMQKMHQRMQTMRQQMEKIHATEDPAERKRLMLEHLQSMRGVMMMMRDMNQTMMPPGGEDGAGAGHEPGAPQCIEDTAQCRQMNSLADRQGQMEQRMGMMQMMMQIMMQQMIEHDALNESDTG